MCIEYKAFSPSYDFAPAPSPPPPPPINKLSLFLSLPVYRRSSLLTGEGGEGAKSYDADKAYSTLQYINYFLVEIM
jgi:hypothetical protein